MEIDVRRARPEDAPALHAMNTVFNGNTGVTPEDVRRSLVSGSEIVLLAEYRGIAAGFCCAQVHHSFCYPAPVAEVTEMYVKESFRRRGCAGAMLRALEAIVRQEYGVDELHLLTGLQNKAAQAAYRKAGYIAHDEQYMYKPLR